MSQNPRASGLTCAEYRSFIQGVPMPLCAVCATKEFLKKLGHKEEE